MDENADSCAARNYHAEMKRHGGDSTLSLIPPDQERCFCVGNANVSADAGSRYASRCGSFLPGLGKTPCVLPPGPNTSHPRGPLPFNSSLPRGRTAAVATGLDGGLGGGLGDGNFVECQYPFNVERCMYHTMGWGGMLEPFMAFVKRTLF